MQHRARRDAPGPPTPSRGAACPRPRGAGDDHDLVRAGLHRRRPAPPPGRRRRRPPRSPRTPRRAARRRRPRTVGLGLGAGPLDVPVASPTASDGLAELAAGSGGRARRRARCAARPRARGRAPSGRSGSCRATSRSASADDSACSVRTTRDSTTAQAPLAPHTVRARSGATTLAVATLPGSGARRSAQSQHVLPPTSAASPPLRERPRPGGAGGALRGAVVGASVAVAAGAGVSALATVYARKVVTPDAEQPDDVEVLAVGAGTVTLRATAGDDRAGPLRPLARRRRGARPASGRCSTTTRRRATVTRRLLGVDRGRLREGPARWNQYFYAGTPAALGPALRGRRASRPSSATMPAWSCRRRPAVPRPGHLGDPRARPGRHPRGVPAGPAGAAPARLPGAGRELPQRRRRPAAAAGGRYHLGDAEWLRRRGRRCSSPPSGAPPRWCSFGWSMGGAIVLQVVARSWAADRVRAVVLDAPVLDWRHVLDHHARLNGLPGPGRPARPGRAAAPGAPGACSASTPRCRWTGSTGSPGRPSCGCRC